LYGDINEFKTGYHSGAELGNYNVVVPTTKRLWTMVIACSVMRFVIICRYPNC